MVLMYIIKKYGYILIKNKHSEAAFQKSVTNACSIWDSKCWVFFQKLFSNAAAFEKPKKSQMLVKLKHL